MCVGHLPVISTPCHADFRPEATSSADMKVCCLLLFVSYLSFRDILLKTLSEKCTEERREEKSKRQSWVWQWSIFHITQRQQAAHTMATTLQRISNSKAKKKEKNFNLLVPVKFKKVKRTQRRRLRYSRTSFLFKKRAGSGIVVCTTTSSPWAFYANVMRERNEKQMERQARQGTEWNHNYNNKNNKQTQILRIIFFWLIIIIKWNLTIFFLQHSSGRNSYETLFICKLYDCMWGGGGIN